jgi:pyruvate,orthophosphate dikinase
MAAKIQKRLKANAKNKNQVVPLQSHRLTGLVTTIGYSVQGLTPALSLLKRSDFQNLKERLGGKGAGLASMVKLGVPVPPAFNLATNLCAIYLTRQNLPKSVIEECKLAIQGMEKTLRKKFGDRENPLLVSVRSGARISMPGMMDTILNLGLTREIVSYLAEKYPTNARFWWDCYRRFVQMFSEVVLAVEASVFDQILENWKARDGVKNDAELSAKTLQNIVHDFEASIQARGKTFPQDPWIQLTAAIEAVFRSWNTDRAIHYRQLHRISEEWGTAVTVQSMVFGNLNDRSATGVVFTRNPSSGENQIYGEYLLNAQGEDVVAGIRTPKPIADLTKDLQKPYRELVKSLARLEKSFNEVQDVEFTIEDNRLFILQTRTAKRTAAAAIEHFLQFVKEKKLKAEAALQKIEFEQVRQLLHPTLRATSVAPLVRGLPASPGAVSGKAVFSPVDAVNVTRAGQKVILVRRDTSPEDIMGMAVAEGILTSTGGMTSHAAVVGRGMGKSCVVGCSDLQVIETQRRAMAHGKSFSEGDWITINGSTGDVYLGELPTEPVTWGKTAQTVFSWADKFSKIPVLANADTPEQARLAVELGARGIGLCRTEHMFFDKERIHKFRLMILSDSLEARTEAAESLGRFQQEDFVGIFREMKGYSVCVRLLDPPLHEFLPKEDQREEIEALLSELSISESKLRARIQQLHEINPMLGHRGCRLGITSPEIYEMQVKALAESLFKSVREKSPVTLKIMIPLIMSEVELKFLLSRLRATFDSHLQAIAAEDPATLKACVKLVKWGTMIELPRACLVASQIAPLVDFFSFGTNDLTQTTLGISRDDASKFIPQYLEQKIISADPFERLDVTGVGRLISLAVIEGRKANPKLDVGICGEHGGDPKSVEFFHQMKFDSVSCSPFRVPLARLAVARATIGTK